MGSTRFWQPVVIFKFVNFHSSSSRRIILIYGNNIIVYLLENYLQRRHQPQIGSSLGSTRLAIIYSIAVGLAFGLYPTNRAANLKPVEV
ncbi:MAG: hypothetical protein WCF08_02725 [Anaerolineaceae bacterium]